MAILVSLLPIPRVMRWRTAGPTRASGGAPRQGFANRLPQAYSSTDAPPPYSPPTDKGADAAIDEMYPTMPTSEAAAPPPAFAGPPQPQPSARQQQGPGGYDAVQPVANPGCRCVLG